jgi:hypothetical protein
MFAFSPVTDAEDLALEMVIDNHLHIASYTTASSIHQLAVVLFSWTVCILLK